MGPQEGAVLIDIFSPLSRCPVTHFSADGASSGSRETVFPQPHGRGSGFTPWCPSSPLEHLFLLAVWFPTRFLIPSPISPVFPYLFLRKSCLPPGSENLTCHLCRWLLPLHVQPALLPWDPSPSSYAAARPSQGNL